MTNEKVVTAKDTKHIQITAPNIDQMTFRIVGTAPYVQHKFSGKAKAAMLQAQEEGSKARGKKKLAARNIKQEFKEATRRTKDGRYGIHTAAFRNAMIDACRLVGFAMTKAKMSVWVMADDYDVDDAAPLVLLRGKTKPKMLESAVRLASGVTYLAYRPAWNTWSADVTIRYDADQFYPKDIANLLARAGMQVGVGEGRPYSKKSNGCGWGTFDVIVDETIEAIETKENADGKTT